MDNPDKKFAIVIEDENGNILVEINNTHCLIARFKSLDDDMKNKITDLFVDITGNDREEVVRFLEFNDKEQRFCS